MIFKDRKDAAKKLVKAILQDKGLSDLLKKNHNFFIVSLLRGGVVLGNIISKQLKIKHLPLPSIKIPAPSNPELAIGAFCFDKTYIEKGVIDSMAIDNKEISQQATKTREKFKSYCKEFKLRKTIYEKIKNKMVLLVDDGIATGATIKAATRFLRSLKPRFLILIVPVAPLGFETKDFDKTIILHKNPCFSSVSQFYEYFPQVENFEVKKLLN